MNYSIEQAFRSALAEHEKNFGRGFQARLSELTGIHAPQINDVLKGRKGFSEEKRRLIVMALGDLTGHAITYEEMLDLGRWILDKKDPDDWPGINRGDIEATMPSLGFTGVMSSGKKVTGNHTLKAEIPTGKRVPVISWVQAGEWTDIVDEFQPGDADQFILVCRNVSEHTFALKINGSSMEPEFMPGDIIIVDPAVQPETGKFVIAKTETGNGDNGEATFKKFQRDGDKIFLIPLNDKFDIMDMTGVDFKIIGCVVQKTKEY